MKNYIRRSRYLFLVPAIFAFSCFWSCAAYQPKEEDFTLELTSDKTEYTRSETIHAEAAFHNESGRTFDITYGARIVNIFLYREGTDPDTTVPSVKNTGKIKKDQTIEQKTDFSAEDLESGNYVILACVSFETKGNNFEKIKEITVRIN